MIFAQTSRLVLRSLEQSDLSRFVALLDVWEIVRWLPVVPYPYTMKDAQDFWSDMQQAERTGAAELFALFLKSDDSLIGATGLHPPRGKTAKPGELELGYWLARDYWGRGFMTEAASAAISIGFDRVTTEKLVATTAENNAGSQNVLRKLGLRDKGLQPRDYAALRGDDMVVRWEMTREEWLLRNKGAC